jgi:hypothetical protein
MPERLRYMATSLNYGYQKRMTNYNRYTYSDQLRAGRPIFVRNLWKIACREICGGISHSWIRVLPKRGDKPEWQHTQDYWTEKDEFPAIDLDDRAFRYE